MRGLVIGCVVLVLGSAGASAQPWFGPGYGPPPPPPPGYGPYGPPPPPPFYGPPRFYGGAYGGRRCWVRPGYFGPERVCRGW